MWVGSSSSLGTLFSHIAPPTLCSFLMRLVPRVLVVIGSILCFFFFSSRRRHTRFKCDWSSDVCSSDLTVGEAHAALAQVAFLWDWDWAAAEKQFKRALELTPADPEIHHMYAHYLTAMGRFDKALAESQRLLELDPLWPASQSHLG